MNGRCRVALVLVGLSWVVPLVLATCSTSNSDAIANGFSATTTPTSTDGFTLTADVATSYYAYARVAVTLTVPSGGDSWVAIELSVRDSGTTLRGSWDTTKSVIVSGNVGTPTHLYCNTTNAFHLVSGTTSPTFNTGKGTARFVWVAPGSVSLGTLSFKAAVSIDSATWFNINGPSLPYLAQQGKCINPKTGNLTWTPHPICNGHGICEFNNTCVCNGTYTGAGCYINTQCGSGFVGNPGHCVACAAGTYKTGFGVTGTNTTDFDELNAILNNAAGVTVYAPIIQQSGTTPKTKFFVHGTLVNGQSLVSGTTFANTTTSPTSATGALIKANIRTADALLSSVTTTPIAAALGGVTLAPGFYSPSSGAFTLTGTLTLHGPAGSIWIFLTGEGGLNVKPNGRMVITGGANNCNVYWSIGGPAGSSAQLTLNSSSNVQGTFVQMNVAALDRFYPGATINGRLFVGLSATFDLTGNGGAVTVIPPTGCTTGGLTYTTTLQCTRCQDTFGLVPLDLAGKYGLLAHDVNLGATVTVSGDAGTISGGFSGGGGSIVQASGLTHTNDDLDTAAALVNLTAVFTPLFNTECVYLPDATLANGLRLKPGNYCYEGNLLVNGGFIFDGNNNPLSVWRFLVQGNIEFGVYSALTSTFSYAVTGDSTLVNSASNNNIFWVAQGTIIVAADSTVNGHLLAQDIVILNDNVHVTGSVFTLKTFNAIATATIGDIGTPQHYINPARFTSPLASIVPTNCSVSGSLCAAGRFYSAGSCSVCAIGTYKTAVGDQDCSLCDLAHTTPSTGATSAAQCSVPLCAPGTCCDPAGLACKNCEYATYKATYGPQVCTACPVGFNTTAKGRTSAAQCSVPVACPKGYRGLHGPCTICPLGTYNNLTARVTPCATCPVGKYSIVAGATSIAQCLPVTPPPSGSDLCSAFLDRQELCERFDVEGCVYNNVTGVCFTATCGNFTDHLSCNFDRHCRWYDSKCNKYMPSSSSAFAVCDSIDGSYGTTYVGLDTYAAACAAEPMCEYACQINHCVVDRNIVATTPDVTRAQCIQDGMGVWVQDTSSCVDPTNLSHTFTGFNDPWFQNFTCSPGVCVVRGRHDPTVFCGVIDATACNALDHACIWDSYIGRCLATENQLSYSLECDFCAFRTSYVENYFNVEVPTLGAQTCVAPACNLTLDCPQKAHCRHHAGSCIPDDAYLCPLLVTDYECTVSIGAGICQTYNSSGICRSQLNPPTGWPVFTPTPSSSSSASVETQFGFDEIQTHLNFIVNLHGFTYNHVTSVLTFYADTPLNWNANNPQEIVIKVGYGGYPGLGYNFNLATISGTSTVPTALGDFAHFINYIVANHDFPPLCLESCGVGLTQDTFPPLSGAGIGTSVIVVADPYQGPVLRFTIQLHIDTITSDGANAGVTGTFVPLGSAPVAGSLVASTDITIPLTVIWRSPTGSNTDTSKLVVSVDNSGQASVDVTGQLGYSVTSTVKDTNFIACTGGQVAEQVILGIRYTSLNANQLWLGPLHIQDLTLLLNCYDATLSGFVAPVCALGHCDSQVTITTECRTPTATGNTFTVCPAPFNTEFDGRFQISVEQWFCEATGQKIKTDCSGQTLLQGSPHDTIATEVLLDTTVNAVGGVEDLTLTTAILPTETSLLSSTVAVSSNGSTNAVFRFVPVVVYFTNPITLNGFNLQIDNGLTTFVISDIHGAVLATPSLTTLRGNGVLRIFTKAFTTSSQASITHCAAVTGCDSFEIDAFGLIAAYPTVFSLSITFVIESAPDGIAIPASRRLLQSSSYAVVVSGSNITITFHPSAFAGRGSSSKLSAGAIAGIAIGSFFGFVLILGLVLWLCWMSMTPEVRGYDGVPAYGSSGSQMTQQRTRPRGAALE